MRKHQFFLVLTQTIVSLATVKPQTAETKQKTGPETAGSNGYSHHIPD